MRVRVQTGPHTHEYHEVAEPPDCVHLGEPIRREDGLRATVPCLPCEKEARQPVNKPLYACAVHGQCTTDGKADGVASCKGCSDKKTDAYQFTVNADGIGDHLAALTVLGGWRKRNPTNRLHLVPRSFQWIDLFEPVYQSAGAAQQGTTPIFKALNDRGDSHFIEAATRIPLAERVRPTLKPLPADAVEWAEQYRGAVILAPISLGSGAGRNWLISHWLLLERMLNERGQQCVIIGSGDDAPKLTQFRGQVLAGKPAAHVAALMRVARCVVSNESGMGHLAGALDVPCVVLAAHLIAAPIYEIWPSARVIQGPLSCGGCRWRGPNFRAACNEEICANLQAITPELVIASMPLERADAPLVNDAVLNREIELHVSKLVIPVPGSHHAPFTVADRRPTTRLFLRHIADCGLAPLVVETGCQRADLDYGAGMSTTIIGLLLRGHGGKLISLDNSIPHVEFCRARCAPLPCEVVLTDSRPWLRDYTGPKIDALYLDSQDTWDPGFQECCLEEAQAALPHLAENAVLMIDDTWRADAGASWNGKGAKAIPWLESKGWRVVCEGWQALLKRVTS